MWNHVAEIIIIDSSNSFWVCHNCFIKEACIQNERMYVDMHFTSTRSCNRCGGKTELILNSGKIACINPWK